MEEKEAVHKNIKMPEIENLDKRREAMGKARAVLRRNGYTVRVSDLDKILRIVKK